MDKIERGERLRKLGPKIGFREDVDVAFFGELMLETDEMFDVFRILRNFDGEAFFRELIMTRAGALRHMG